MEPLATCACGASPAFDCEVQCEGFRFLEYVALAMVMERKKEMMSGTPHDLLTHCRRSLLKFFIPENGPEPV